MKARNDRLRVKQRNASRHQPAGRNGAGRASRSLGQIDRDGGSVERGAGKGRRKAGLSVRAACCGAGIGTVRPPGLRERYHTYSISLD